MKDSTRMHVARISCTECKQAIDNPGKGKHLVHSANCSTGQKWAEILRRIYK